MKTIAEQLNIKDFPFVIKDNQGNLLYYEDSTGYWSKRKYDSKGNEIYFEDSDEFWRKKEFDSKGNRRYYEASDGLIIDNRPKHDVITLNGIKYKRIDE
jgi:hypothetical protein